MAEMVDHPKHYQGDKMECIDIIEAVIGEYGEEMFCIGNVIKYLCRHEKKNNALEDLKKARWYMNRAIESHEKLAHRFDRVNSKCNGREERSHEAD